MSPVFQIALSGLNAQSTRVSVAASNIANARSVGVNPAPGADNSNAYTPQRVQQVSVADGGVRVDTLPVSPPSLPVFDPSNPDANAEGVAFLPNVSLEAELVEVLQASAAFKANVQVIQTQDELLGSLVDIAS
ncbi:MAG: flagellar basal body rod C-terminal domain-containing protein [Kiloniellales bacterium]|nr:flagellar basal body rod C-terminal domain-containing protein [Kiloniellales bacterium]MDJ0968301.1 flagellar basal body rod C-terminal domain-containing protein [Kiloniellales bacterium]MDJ0980596.1 flagellar basal body rod C-terminal domain-containing protein [Kiloniellales bacterium]